MSHLIRATVFLLCTALAAPVGAQDFDEGLTAARGGDFVTAFENWQPFAEQGHAVAQYNIGIMYYTGQGVPQNYAEAARWYHLAAEQGYADAQFGLGTMLRESLGVL